MAHLVSQRHGDVRFLVAGDGDLSDPLADRIRAEQLPIDLLGWRDDVGTIMSAADVVLLTSDNEGTPISLIQAALLGVPVVSSSVGDVPDVVIDSVTGLLGAPDSSILAQKVDALLTDPQRACDMGRAAQRHAAERFGVDPYVAAHERLYEEIAQERRP